MTEVIVHDLLSFHTSRMLCAISLSSDRRLLPSVHRSQHGIGDRRDSGSSGSSVV